VKILMQFGDGTFIPIDVESNEPESAVEEARDWVMDNAWFEAQNPDEGEILAECRLDSDLSRR
jgi:hypothetical protein